jgi:hypothetical protein
MGGGDQEDCLKPENFIPVGDRYNENKYLDINMTSFSLLSSRDGSLTYNRVMVLINST